VWTTYLHRRHPRYDFPFRSAPPDGASTLKDMTKRIGFCSANDFRVEENAHTSPGENTSFALGQGQRLTLTRQNYISFLPRAGAHNAAQNVRRGAAAGKIDTCAHLSWRDGSVKWCCPWNSVQGFGWRCTKLHDWRVIITPRAYSATRAMRQMEDHIINPRSMSKASGAILPCRGVTVV
jgi:hypothetical protein